MSPLLSPNRLPAGLSPSVQQRLTAYALAFTAAGVGFAAVPGQARIVFTQTHRTLTNGTLPIPIAGTHLFNLTDKFYIITGSWSSQFLDLVASGDAAVLGGKSASALRAGKVIGPRDRFKSGKRQMAGAFCETQISQSTVFGPFANTAHRFLGLRFKLHGKTHYGWARFSAVNAAACNGGPAISATLTGYAYETVPNKPIVAGQMNGPDAIASEHTSLGRLALGAFGRPAKGSN